MNNNETNVHQFLEDLTEQLKIKYNVRIEAESKKDIDSPIEAYKTLSIQVEDWVIVLDLYGTLI